MVYGPDGPFEKMNPILANIQRYLPVAIKVDARERARSLFGAVIGIFITGLAGLLVIGSANPQPWLIAPMGASAVLLFAAPASPLAQPWSVVGGNLISALAGVTCAKLIGDPLFAGSVAVGTAIGMMFVLRCLHPPGGAVALSMALGGPLIAGSSYWFMLSPVALNCLLLLASAFAYNKLCGRRYPYVAVAAVNQHRTDDAIPSERVGVTPADLDAVMKQYNQVLDISQAELEEILARAQAHAYQRRFGKLTCGDIMSRDVVKVEFGTSLQDAWRLLCKHEIKGLPVVNEPGRVIGIVTRHDFVKQLDLSVIEGLPGKLRRLLMPDRNSHSGKAEVVGQIMTSQVQSAALDQSVLSVVPLFSDHGRHHLPIVDGNGRLVGILTQSDVVAALYRSQLKHLLPTFGEAQNDLRKRPGDARSAA